MITKIYAAVLMVLWHAVEAVTFYTELTDYYVAADLIDDLGYNSTVASKRLLCQNIFNSGTAENYVIGRSNNEITTFYDPVANTTNAQMARTLVKMSEVGSAFSGGIIFHQGGKFYYDDRVISLEKRTLTNLLTITPICTEASTITTYAGKLYCQDARNITGLIYVVCKYKETASRSQVRIFVFNITEGKENPNSGPNSTIFNDVPITGTDYANSATGSWYYSNTNSFYQIHWTGYPRGSLTDCSTVEDLIVIIEHAFSTSSHTASKPVVILAGKAKLVNQVSDVYFKISHLIDLSYTDATQPTPAAFESKYTLMFGTNAYSITTSGGQTTCKNMFYVLAYQTSLPSSKNNCWTDMSNFDEIIANFLRQAPASASTKIPLKCISTDTVNTVSYAMSKVARLTDQHELYLRAKFVEQGGVRKIAYDVGLLKPADVIVSTSSTQFSNYDITEFSLDINAMQNSFLNVRIQAVVPEKLLYVCWGYYNQYPTGSNGLPPTPDPTQSLNCRVVDIFTIDKSKFDSLNVITVVDCITFLRREYGDFMDVHFDVDFNTFLPIRMLAFKRFNLAANSALNGNAFTTYDTTKYLYSIQMSIPYSNPVVGPVVAADERKIFIQDLNYDTTGSNTPLSPIVILKNSPTFISSTTGIEKRTVPFKELAWILIDDFSDRIFSPDLAITFGNAPSGTNPKSIVKFLYKLSKTITVPSGAESKIIMVDLKYIEFNKTNSTSPTTFAIYGYSIAADKPGTQSSAPVFDIAQNFVHGSPWTPTNEPVLSYANFKYAEQLETGLYAYFSNATKWAVFRFDIERFLFTYQVFDYEVRVFESTARIFVVYFNNSNPAVSTYVNVELVPPTTVKALGQAQSVIFIQNFTVPTFYSLLNRNDMSIVVDKDGRSIIFNMIVTTTDATKPRLLYLQYYWEDPRQIDKIGFQFRKKFIFDDDIGQLTTGNLRCLGRDFLAIYRMVGTTEARLTVYNMTKKSFYSYSETTAAVTNLKLFCASEFVVLANTELKLLTMILTSADLEQYKRVRAKVTPWSTSQDPTQAMVCFGPRAVNFIYENNQFHFINKYQTRIYMQLGNTNPQPATLDPMYNWTTVMTTGIQMYKPGATTTVEVQIVPQEMHKKSMFDFQPIYVGPETMELQKKIMYDSTKRTNYDIENDFRLPMSFFDVKFVSKIPSDKISFLERVRRNSDFNLWEEATEVKVEKRCGFAKRGTREVKLIDDVMMRVDVSDDSFCVQLSRVGIQDNKLVTLKRTDFSQSNEVVWSCNLIRDGSLWTFADVDAKVKAGQNIDYFITCISKTPDAQYLWIMYIPLGQSFDNIFRPLENLIKIPITFVFSYYKAISTGNSIFVAFMDSASNRFYHFKSVYTFGIAGQTLPTFSDMTAQTFELVSTVPSEPDKKVTGIEMIVNFVKPVDTSVIQVYRAAGTGDMIPSSESWATVQVAGLLGNMSCMFQKVDPIEPFTTCTYVLAHARNTLFYWIRPHMVRGTVALPTDTKENFVSPVKDLQIRQFEILYYDRAWYIQLAYSPVKGQKYLIVYKHPSSTNIKGNIARNYTDLATHDLLIHDSVDITNSNIDLDNSDISMPIIGGVAYLTIRDGANLQVYKFGHFEISIAQDIPFDDIAQTRMVITDHFGTESLSTPLSVFFREKVNKTFTWFIVFGVAVLITGVLTCLYLLFKKRRDQLEEEITKKSSDNSTARKKKNKKEETENDKVKAIIDQEIL